MKPLTVGIAGFVAGWLAREATHPLTRAFWPEQVRRWVGDEPVQLALDVQPPPERS